MNSNIYEEKKRFNLVDALIVLLILLMVFVVIFRAQIISLFTGTGSAKDCTVSFVCEAIPNELTASVKNGDTLVWLDNEVKLGRLSMTSVPVASDEYYYKGTELYWNHSDSTMKFYGTIACTAVSNNGCYIDGSNFLASGMLITVSTGTVQFEILVTDIAFAD